MIDLDALFEHGIRMSQRNGGALWRLPISREFSECLLHDTQDYDITYVQMTEGPCITFSSDGTIWLEYNKYQDQYAEQHSSSRA